MQSSVIEVCRRWKESVCHRCQHTSFHPELSRPCPRHSIATKNYYKCFCAQIQHFLAPTWRTISRTTGVSVVISCIINLFYTFMLRYDDDEFIHERWFDQNRYAWWVSNCDKLALFSGNRLLWHWTVKTHRTLWQGLHFDGTYVEKQLKHCCTFCNISFRYLCFIYFNGRWKYTSGWLSYIKTLRCPSNKPIHDLLWVFKYMN